MDLKYIVNNKKYSNIKQVLREEFHISSRLFLKLKNNYQIYLNGKKSSCTEILNANDIIEVDLGFNEDNSNIVPTEIDLNIIYEDNYLLIINKEPGIAVHPSILHYNNSLSNGVKHYFDKINLNRKIRIVNRLDRDTSGIVIFAKNEYIQECLIHQMSNNTFKKEYIGILEGSLDKKEGTISAPIARKDGSIIERCVDENGQSSITHYDVIKETNNLSLVHFILDTGRTHQIRVHSKYIGHPILGDTLYGSPSELISRQALHAWKVNFIHPITNKEMHIEANLPDDMKRVVK